MNVQQFRQSRGLTLRQLADMVGCSPSNVMRIEKGQRPQYDTAEAFVLASKGVITLKEIYRNGAGK